MMTSVKELKERLRAFLADPEDAKGFQSWFALALRDDLDPATETLAHEIMWAYLDQKRGLCTAAELGEILNQLASPCDVLFGVESSVTTGYTSSDPQEVAAFVLGGLRVGVRHVDASGCTALTELKADAAREQWKRESGNLPKSQIPPPPARPAEDQGRWRRSE